MSTVNYNSPALVDYMIPDNFLRPQIANKNYLVTPSSFNFLFKNESGIASTRVEIILPGINNSYLMGDLDNTFFTAR